MRVVATVSDEKVDEVPLHLRPIPKASWRIIFVLMLVMATAGLAAWEVEMRRLGMTTDVGDGIARWSVERRKVDSGPGDSLVVAGDSRLLYDTDLQVWRELTGMTPIQLAIAGGSGRPVLRGLAEDAHFTGLVVVGLGTSYFANVDGGFLSRERLDYWKNERFAKRFGEMVYVGLSHWFAFLEDDYSLPSLIEMIYIPNRGSIRGPFLNPGKLGVTLENRQTYMWSRMVSDKSVYSHMRLTWDPYTPKTYSKEKIDSAIEETRRDVEAIRKRGGEVAFVQAPVAGDLYTRIWTDLPRNRGWDPLIAKAEVVGVHFEDYPEMQNLDLPEWSHLTRESATKFTGAYVTVLKEKLPWLRAHMRTH